MLLTPHLYGLGNPKQPSPRVTPVEVTFILFLCKINQPFTLESRICLASEGGEAQAGGTTFLHINALARLTETTLGVASVP